MSLVIYTTLFFSYLTTRILDILENDRRFLILRFNRVFIFIKSREYEIANVDFYLFMVHLVYVCPKIKCEIFRYLTFEKCKFSALDMESTVSSSVRCKNGWLMRNVLNTLLLYLDCQYRTKLYSTV